MADPKAARGSTSGNREESMSDKSEESSSQGDGSPDKDLSSKKAAPEDLDPSSSGTTSLIGETGHGNARPGPGGVEGESGNG